MTPRDPESLSEWLGYFLFHDRFPVSVAGICGLLVIGWWIGNGAEQVARLIKRRRKNER